MKQSIWFKGFVLAAVVLPIATGCKPKDGGGAAAGSGSATTPAAGSGSAATPAAGSGSAAAPAAGSGSAVAAAGSGSAAAPAAGPQAPWAADAGEIPKASKVTGKRDGADKGTFDRALYFKFTDEYGSVHYQLHIANGCDKFSCNYFTVLRGSVYPGDDSYKACEDATMMDIDIEVADGAELKAGPVDLDVSINGPSSGGGLSGEPMKGSAITSISDKEVKGKIAVKDADGKNEAKGDFVAKNCGSVVIPKK